MVKRLSIIILTIVCIFSICPKDSLAVSPSTIMEGGNKFIEEAEDREVFDKTNEKDAIDTLYYIMLSIAIVVAFIVGSVLGIQFITSGAAGQAKVKEKIIPFALGTLVAFGAFGIWRITYNVLNGLF